MYKSFDELCPYVRKAGKQNGASWKGRMRRIYDHQLFFCCRGTANVCIEDRVYEMTPGTSVLVKPNTRYSFWQEDISDIYWVHFDFIYRSDVYSLENYVVNNGEKLFSEILPEDHYIREDIIWENGFTFPEYIKIEQRELMEGMLQKLLFHYSNKDLYWQLECKISLLHILKTIINQTVVNNSPSSSKEKMDITNSAVNYIRKNYFRKLSIGEIAKAAGISSDHLGKVFKKSTGLTVVDFITEHRLSKAKELLACSDLSISDICEMVGFSDVYYFSKVVKKYEGVPPSALRELIKEG